MRGQPLPLACGLVRTYTMVKTISTQSPEVNVSNNGRGNYKTLIACASQFGTTGEVAEVMADALSKEGNIVDTQWVKSVKDINNYDAVIIKHTPKANR